MIEQILGWSIVCLTVVSMVSAIVASLYLDNGRDKL